MTVHGPLRSFVLVALILLAAGVAPVTTAFAATDPQRSSDYYDQALQHLGKEDFGAALIELKNALAEDPENLSARLLLGQVHLLLGDGLSAEHAYKRAMRSGADDTLTLMPLAQAYLMQRKYDELLKDIHSGGRPTEVEIQILLARGDALTHLRRLKEGALAYRGRPADLTRKAPSRPWGSPKSPFCKANLGRPATSQARRWSGIPSCRRPGSFAAKCGVLGAICRGRWMTSRPASRCKPTICLHDWPVPMP